MNEQLNTSRPAVLNLWAPDLCQVGREPLPGMPRLRLGIEDFFMRVTCNNPWKGTKP